MLDVKERDEEWDVSERKTAPVQAGRQAGRQTTTVKFTRPRNRDWIRTEHHTALSFSWACYHNTQH